MAKFRFSRWFVLVAIAAAFLAMGATTALGVDAPGTYVGTWGAYGSGDSQFYYPRGIAFDGDGNVYVVDSENDYVKKFSPDGTFISKFGGYGSGPGQLDIPIDAGVDGDGNVYVLEFGNNRVSKFNSAGTFIMSWGNFGAGDNQFSNGYGISVSQDGDVYVADSGNNQIKRFTSTGVFVSKWGKADGTTGNGNGEFDFPLGLEVDTDGTLYVADAGNARIQKFDPSGAFELSWQGGLSTWLALTIDGDGIVYVTDTYNDCVKTFSPEGDLLATWGVSGSEPGQLSLPLGIGIHPENGYAYVADYQNHRVNYYVSGYEVAPPEDLLVQDLEGASRYGTALEVSLDAFPEGAGSVVIATGENYPDALGGSALAGVLEAPILLTTSSTLLPAVADEIERLGAREVYVLGGTNALSDDVMADLDALIGAQEGRVIRIGGANRYRTAELIAAEVVDILGEGYEGEAFVATGENFADALAASPLAAYAGMPVYLAPQPVISDQTIDAMEAAGVTDVVLLGGEAALPKEVGVVILKAGMSAVRIDGVNRYQTAAKVAEYGVDTMGMDWEGVAIATGETFADALSGGASQGAYGSVMLLTGKTVLPTSTATVLSDNAGDITYLRFLGGPSAISGGVRNEIFDLF